MSEIRSIPGSIQSDSIQPTNSQEISTDTANVNRVSDASDTIEGSSEQATFEALMFDGSGIHDASSSVDVGIQRLNDLRTSFDTEVHHALDSVKQFEEKLNSIGDDAQLANVDMQNWLQKQQQTLQMMSNISKMFFDNAMAIIRKIGG